jgi:hypothetical protein
LRLRLVKIVASLVEMKTMIHVHLPASCPEERTPQKPGQRNLAGSIGATGARFRQDDADLQPELPSSAPTTRQPGRANIRQGDDKATASRQAVELDRPHLAETPNLSKTTSAIGY